jgi:hypothetical protein
MFAHSKGEIEMKRKTLFSLLVGLVVVMVLLGGVLMVCRVWAQDTRFSRPSRELASEGTVQSATAGGASFDITQLTSSVNMEGTAVVAVDDAGNVHVAYVSDYSEIYYRTYANGAWSGDTLVTSGALTGYEPSLAVDSSGYAHIAYQAQDSVDFDSDIYYATNAGGSFVNTLLTSSGTADESAPSVAVDGNQKVHIAYTTDAGGDSEVVYHSNVGGWGSTVVTNNSQDDYYPSIAVDVAGTVHIAYERWATVTSQVYYANNDGGWSSELVPSGVTHAVHAAIAVDASGQPHIVFLGQVALGYAGFYATKSGSSWAVSQPVSFDTGGDPTIDVDAFGKAHIACVEISANAAVHHMTNFSGSWSDTTVTSVPAGYDLASSDRHMALDRAGFVHVVYNDRTVSGFPEDVYYARSTQPLGSRWRIETVDAVGTAGWDTSLELDSDERPHISYHDASMGTLEYVYWDGAAWQNTTVDDSDWVGWYTSLDLALGMGPTGGDIPFISYYDVTNGALKMAYNTGASGWVSETVDSAGGTYTSLAVDYRFIPMVPHISYYDWTNGDLKYATYDANIPGWVTQTVQSAGDVGAYSSLALDSGYHPHIAYCDTTAGRVPVAWYDGASWYTDTLGFGVVSADSSSLALDGNDNPHVSYHGYFSYQGNDYSAAFYDYQDSFGTLYGAIFDLTAWVPGQLGYTSVALDSAGHAHFSYYDSEHGDLKYAYEDGATWYTQVVDTAGDVGWYTSLELDSLGLPHISYYDATNGDLKYAHLVPYQTYLPLALRNYP